MQLSKINNILQKFSIEAISFEDISKKGFSGASIFLIKTKDSEFVLKGYEAEVDQARANFIHEVMNEAHRNGFKMLPRLMKTKSSESIFSLNGRIWELMSVIPGTPLCGMPGITLCVELGKAVGELHRSLNTFPDEKVLRRRGIVTYKSLIAHHNQFTDLVDIHSNLFEKYGTIDIIKKYIKLSKSVLINYFDQDIFDQFQKIIPRLVIHQDLWGPNIFFQGEKFMGFIDFVNAKHCVRLDDIAKLIIEVLELSEKETLVFLRAYDSVWAFTTEEKRLLLSWILNWVIFSPFWHVEQYIKKEIVGIENRTRYVEMIERSQKILERLQGRELEFLNERDF